MHLYLDSADRTALEPLFPHPLLYGVTTNPTLMRAAGLGWVGLPDFIRFALDRGAKAVQVQVQSEDVRGIVRDAQSYARWAEPGCVIAKIPATRAGLAAAAELTGEGIPVTMTAVYAPEQALWSAAVGARYAAPYLGRLNDSGKDGLALIRDMQTLLNLHHAPTPPLRLLVASLRSREAVLEVLRLGVGAITIPPRLFTDLVDHPETQEAERVFLADVAALR